MTVGRIKEPTGPARFLAADSDFAPAFSHFLRQTPEVWRMRRVDHFRPLDANLVEHKTTIQGRINADLVTRFLDSREGQKLKIDDRRVLAGEDLTLYLPAIRQPKRILLEFSAWDRDGATLSILQRYEGAQVAAGYILALLEADKSGKKADATGAGETGELLPARIVLAALMFLNPQDMLNRLMRWARDRPQESAELRLRAWVESEGELFLRGCGTFVTDELDSCIKGATGGKAVPIPDWARVDALRPFRTLTQLLLYGIRDVIKVVVDAADAHRPDAADGEPAAEAPISAREKLLSDPDEFAEAVGTVLVDGLRDLRDLIGKQSTTTAEDELFRNLAVWAAYVPLTVQLDIPFTLHFAQTEPAPTPLNWPPWRQPYEERLARFWRTSQEYPLVGALKDAGAVHIEIAVPDQELRLGKPLWWRRLWQRFGQPAWRRVAPRWHLRRRKKRRIPRDRIALIARLPDGDVRVAPLDRFFGVVERPTERLLHIYSSRQTLEAKHEDDIYRYLGILVPLRLSMTTYYAYFFAAIAFLGAALYVGVRFARAVWSGETPSDLEPVMTVAALAATLTLWLVTVHHPRPIINGKVLPARAAFFVALIVIVGTPLVFVIGQIVRFF